jgi:hypothetical protein
VARARIVPLPALLPALPGIVLSPRGAARAAHGQDVGPNDLEVRANGPTVADLASLQTVRLLGIDGSLIGIAERRQSGGALHPVIVLRYDSELFS